MPNAKGGKKFKRGKKTIHETKLIYKDPKEDQEYVWIGESSLGSIELQPKQGLLTEVIGYPTYYSSY